MGFLLLENSSAVLLEDGSSKLALEQEASVATLALIQAAQAAQGPANDAAAAIQAALAADLAIYTDLQANGPAAVVDATQTPPVVVVYSAASGPNPYLAAIAQSGEYSVSAGPIQTYVATPVRTAT